MNRAWLSIVFVRFLPRICPVRVVGAAHGVRLLPYSSQGQEGCRSESPSEASQPFKAPEARNAMGLQVAKLGESFKRPRCYNRSRVCRLLYEPGPIASISTRMIAPSHDTYTSTEQTAARSSGS